MRYVYVGNKIPQTGKTLWEVVGNLKNFGVGRLIKRSDTLEYPELSFCKIVRVLPLPPPENSSFNNRPVEVWFEEIHRGIKKGIVHEKKGSDIPQYHLIPKTEEAKYLKQAENLGTPVKHLKKYCPWPPLYKKLWEQESLKDQSTPIPKLKITFDGYEGCKIIGEEAEVDKIECSLYKTERSVDEMYREIVALKKLIISHTPAQQEE